MTVSKPLTKSNYAKSQSFNINFHGFFTDQAIVIEDTKVALKEIHLLCFDIGCYSVKIQLMLCSLGIFIFYILYGYLQVSRAFVNELFQVARPM